MFVRVWKWWHGERDGRLGGDAVVVVVVVVVLVDVVAVVGQPAFLVLGPSDLFSPLLPSSPSSPFFSVLFFLSLKQLLGLLCVILTPP